MCLWVLYFWEDLVNDQHETDVRNHRQDTVISVAQLKVETLSHQSGYINPTESAHGEFLHTPVGFCDIASHECIVTASRPHKIERLKLT